MGTAIQEFLMILETNDKNIYNFKAFWTDYFLRLKLVNSLSPTFEKQVCRHNTERSDTFPRLENAQTYDIEKY